MPLPKIDHPLFKQTLPISEKKVVYRPFTVKEEKILLVARESEEIDQIVLSLEQVVNNCVQEGDISDISIMDFEYLFVKIRSQSVNNSVDFTINDPDTEEEVKLSLSLDDMKKRETEGHSKKIRIAENMLLVMRYPNVREYLTMIAATEDDEAKYELIMNCMESLATEDEIYDFKDYSTEEKVEFMNDLDHEGIKGIKNFFETMPSYYYEIPYTTKDGDEKTFVIEGLHNFFT